jgi:hypothetical protein
MNRRQFTISAQWVLDELISLCLEFEQVPSRIAYPLTLHQALAPLTSLDEHVFRTDVHLLGQTMELEGWEGHWSAIYRGHYLAAQRRNRVWQLQLNQEVLANREFETVEEAAAWLRRRVDEQIAEAIFPGLRTEHAPIEAHRRPSMALLLLVTRHPL